MWFTCSPQPKKTPLPPSPTPLHNSPPHPCFTITYNPTLLSPYPYITPPYITSPHPTTPLPKTPTPSLSPPTRHHIRPKNKAIPPKINGCFYGINSLQPNPKHLITTLQPPKNLPKTHYINPTSPYPNLISLLSHTP
jgi:hypothetical protein